MRREALRAAAPLLCSAIIVGISACTAGGASRVNVLEPTAAVKEERAPAAGPRLAARIVGPAFSASTPVELEYRIDARGPAERVEVWTTADRGEHWTFAAEDPDRRSPVTLSLPPGEHGVFLAVAVRGAEPLHAPAPGEAPHAVVVVDVTAPRAEIAEVRAKRSGTVPPPASTPLIVLELAFRVEDERPDPAGPRLEWRLPGGRWTAAPAGRPGDGSWGTFEITMPEPTVEPLEARLTAFDRAGNATSVTEEVHVLDLLDSPRLELLSFDDGGVYAGGAQREVRFQIDWPRLAPGGAALAFSSDAGRSWSSLAHGLEPGQPFAWGLPEINSSSCVIELSARGRCGFRASRRSKPFRIDSVAPQARITGPRFSTRRSVELSVWARDSGPAGLDHLVLYAAAQGEPPVKIGQYPPAGTVPFESDRAGEIGLWLAAVDKAGNSSRPPADGDVPSFVLEIDSRETELGLESFSSGGVFRGGSSLYIFLRGSENLLDRPLELSLSDGPDGAWKPIARGLTFRERHLWRLPEATGEGFRLQAEVVGPAGEKIRAVSARSFSIDSSPPAFELVGAEPVGPSRVRLRYHASDEPAGVARVRLWRLAPADQPPWKDLASADAVEGEGTLEVDLPPGRQGLFGAAEDVAGNAGAGPGGAEDVQLWVDVPSKPLAAPAAAGQPSPVGAAPIPETKPAAEPRLTLLNFHEGAYRGGDRRYIFWKLETPQPADARINIHCSRDGGATWSEIARGLPAEAGRCLWELPREPGSARRLSLRLLARGTGVDLTAVSRESFLVDSRVPRASMKGPAASRRPRTHLRYALIRPEEAPGAGETPPTPVVRVECYVRAAAGDPWTFKGARELEAHDARFEADDEPAGPGPIPAAEEADSEPLGEDEVALEVALADGRYEVALVPVDAVGNRPALPAAGQPASGSILIDTVQPRLKVHLEGQRDQYHPGETLAIRIDADDENFAEFPISVESAGGNGDAWQTREARFPRGRTYSYRVPDDIGPRRLRIAARDLAGNRVEEVIDFRVAPRDLGLRLIEPAATRVVRAGDPLMVRWQTRNAERAGAKVTVKSTLDGGRTWTEVAAGVQNEGLYAWKAPDHDVADLRIRVEVAGPNGEKAVAESPPLIVSARAPKVVLEGVEAWLPPASPVAPGAGGEKERSEK